MQMKLFVGDWGSIDAHQIEDAVNRFLATLPKGAVKFVQTATSATRTDETDQMQTEIVVSVWYEGKPKKSGGSKKG